MQIDAFRVDADEKPLQIVRIVDCVTRDSFLMVKEPVSLVRLTSSLIAQAHVHVINVLLELNQTRIEPIVNYVHLDNTHQMTKSSV